MGLEAEHVGNLGMATATDEVILAEGQARDAVVVTLDSDFHAILALSKALSPSVIADQTHEPNGDLNGS